MTLVDSVVHHPFVIPLGPLPITGFGIAVAIAFFAGQLLRLRRDR